MKLFLIVIAIVAVTGFFFIKQDISPGSVAVNVSEVNESDKEPEQIPEISVSVSILPERIIQGELVLVTINGTQAVKSITFEGKRLDVFNNEGKLQALIGIDLRKISGKYPLVVILVDGTVIKKDITVGGRGVGKKKVKIPGKL